jgi:hypothetical protein
MTATRALCFEGRPEAIKTASDVARICPVTVSALESPCDPL